MNLCHHRPLFLVSACFIAAMTLGCILPVGWLWMLGGLLLCAAIPVGALLWRSNRRRALLIAACLLSVSLAAILSLGAYHSTDQRRLDASVGDTVALTGIITERRASGGYLTTYTLELESLNGTETSGRLLLSCQYVSDLQPGYRITAVGALVTLDEAIGERYSTAALRADGCTAALVSEAEADVTLHDEHAGHLGVRLGALRRTLSSRLDRLCGDEAAGLPSALLLGERVHLSEEVRRDFARAGVSHILSISGMHMTLLFGLLAALLTALRIPKRIRTVLLLLGAVGYLALVGFIPSATRSVIMLTMVYLATLRAGRADPLTSLGLAGALILAVTPYAAYDVGFWLSLLSTFGLVAYAPLFSGRTRSTASGAARILPMLRKIAYALFVGLVAMSASLFLTAAAIGEVSLLSPAMTLLLTPATAALLILSPLALALASTPLGPLLATLCRALSAWMAEASSVCGSSDWVVISLRHPAILPIAIVMLLSIVVLLCLRLPTRRRWLTVTPLVCGWLIIAAVLGMHSLRTADTLRATYLQSSSQSETLVLVHGQSGFVCDLSNGSLTALSAAVTEAEARGATELAAIMLTHYHTRTSGALSHILARKTVRALYLPTPTTPEDYFRLLACLDAAAEAGTPAYLYAPGDAVPVSGGATISLQTATLERSTQPVLLVTLDTADSRTVYVGSAVFESTLSDTAASLIATADTVIFGHHGPVTKAPFGRALAYRTDRTVTVILPAHGPVPGYLDPTPLPDSAVLWYGQRRFDLSLTTDAAA